MVAYKVTLREREKGFLKKQIQVMANKNGCAGYECVILVQFSTIKLFLYSLVQLSYSCTV